MICKCKQFFFFHSVISEVITSIRQNYKQFNFLYEAHNSKESSFYYSIYSKIKMHTQRRGSIYSNDCLFSRDMQFTTDDYIIKLRWLRCWVMSHVFCYITRICYMIWKRVYIVEWTKCFREWTNVVKRQYVHKLVSGW